MWIINYRERSKSRHLSKKLHPPSASCADNNSFTTSRRSDTFVTRSPHHFRSSISAVSELAGRSALAIFVFSWARLSFFPLHRSLCSFSLAKAFYFPSTRAQESRIFLINCRPGLLSSSLFACCIWHLTQQHPLFLVPTSIVFSFKVTTLH